MNIDLTELEIGFIKQGLLMICTSKFAMGDTFDQYEKKYQQIKPIIEKFNQAEIERIEVC